jgi:hypothetical protein
MARKLVVAGSTALLIAALALPGSAAAQGASDCQPAAGQGTAALAHQLGGLGTAAKAVATSQPGAIATLNKGDLFNCP